MCLLGWKPGCYKPMCRNVLVKYEIVKQVPVYKTEVLHLCCGCGGGPVAGCGCAAGADAYIDGVEGEVYDDGVVEPILPDDNVAPEPPPVNAAFRGISHSSDLLLQPPVTDDLETLR